MTKEQIIAKFPVTVKVTKYSISKAKRMNTIKCLGARTLRKVVGNKVEIGWGVADGNIYNELVVTTKENVNFMRITEPCTVTLIIKE